MNFKYNYLYSFNHLLFLKPYLYPIQVQLLEKNKEENRKMLQFKSNNEKLQEDEKSNVAKFNELEKNQLKLLNDLKKKENQNIDLLRDQKRRSDEIESLSKNIRILNEQSLSNVSDMHL